MADYVSSLTGVAMDAALLDMAEHTSEAYAIGERNGVPVDSGDVAYHNNARYYAQQAQSIAPASVTEAVRWDVAQTALTNANKEMARANIDAGKIGAWTNPNLLDNPWFTVNQRVATTVSTQNAYIADRWKVSGNTYTWTYGRAALSLTNSNNSLAYLVQALEPDLSADLNGKTVTFSVILDGTLYSVSFVWDKTARNYAVNIPNLTNIMFWYGGNGEACIRWITSGTFVVSAVKLELGSVSTLANDVPPDYASELAKCKYYFNRVYSGAVMGSGWATSATNAIILLPVPQMRTTPTLSVTSVSTFRMKGAGGVSVVPSAVTINSASQVGVCINVTISGATTHDLYCLSGTDATAYIDLSADL